VIDRTGIFIGAVAIFVMSLIAIAAYYYRRARNSTQNDWESLLSRLTRVDRSSIAEVALDVIDESGQQRNDQGSAILEPPQIWKLLGGMEGIEALEANSRVLIDLAFYLQQWYPEALVVAEQLRLSAREIEWQVGRLRGAAQTGKLESAFPMYAQRAAAAYYLMTQRLLDLYEQGNPPRLAALQKAL
jgi:hypothetical protein